jgi:transposase
LDTIPVNIRNRRRPRLGRPYRLDLETYKRMKSSVERFFAWLTNGFRRLAIRWERLASTFTAFIQLACIIIYLGNPPTATMKHVVQHC